MFTRSIYIFIFINLLFPYKSNGYEIKLIQDTLKILQDSTKTRADSLKYLEFEKKSSKSKFMQYLHNFFFRSLIPDAKRKIKESRPYRFAEGKIIRKINITTLDPFGFNIKDTLKQPQGFFQKTANQLHLKTEPFIIRNLLLFKKNERYDSLKVNESIRLIRSQQYVQDVLLYSLPSSKRGDSIDVYIRVLDVWSMVPSFELTRRALGMKLSDNNFAGLGNTFYGEMYGNNVTGQSIIRFGYLIPNIEKTYINVNIQYLFSNYKDLLLTHEINTPRYTTISSNLPYSFSVNKGITKGFELSRPFYSPLAKYAGGIFLGQMITSQGYMPQDSVRYLTSLSNIQDYWAARSWQLFEDYAGDYITSLIVSGRYLKMRFKEKPPEAEPAGLFTKEDLFFAGIGITSRKYVQDRYIFNYGKVEDVPVGRSFGLTLGYDTGRDRLYAGLKANWGNYYTFGYLSSELEYGTFIKKSGFNQEVLSGRINYVTKLITAGNWKIRQFIRPNLVLGIRRLPAENLTLSDEIRGFKGTIYPAKHKFVLNMQTQGYAPWNLSGFHFGPYFFCSLGMLGDETSGFLHSPIYSLFGLGILIKNDYLMFSNFQLSFSIFPTTPGNFSNKFRFNSYNNSDFGFMDFEVKKPVIINYR